jgi:hypothetical protein
MILDDVTRDEYLANYTPTIELEEFGGHWIEVWNMVRDQELFSPWYKRKKDHIIRYGEPNIAPDVLHRRTVDLFKCLDIYQGAYAAHFRYPVLSKLPQVSCPVLLNSPDSTATKAALGAAKSATAKKIPNERDALAVELLSFFG